MRGKPMNLTDMSFVLIQGKWHTGLPCFSVKRDSSPVLPFSENCTELQVSLWRSLVNSDPYRCFPALWLQRNLISRHLISSQNISPWSAVPKIPACSGPLSLLGILTAESSNPTETQNTTQTCLCEQLREVRPDQHNFSKVQSTVY